MIQRISINPHQIAGYTECTLNAGGTLSGFPLLTIDTDSYIVGAEIQSGLNFRVEQGCHMLCIGKGCSLADGITFMIDLNHNYGAVAQGELSFLSGVIIPDNTRRKGSVIIQNDVWVGHGATIMAGVTLHNGCIVAAGAVVTKDVPPYAIVGGNPAKVIRYRFEENTIAGLQKIAWWDWPDELRAARKRDFALSPAEFVKKYLPEADERLASVPVIQREGHRRITLIIPDGMERFPLWQKALRRFFASARSDDELLIYLPEALSTEAIIENIKAVLKQYEAVDCYVMLQTGKDIDEHALFEYADYYMTTRGRETVRRTCLCNLHRTQIVFGTDEGILDFERV